MREDELLTPRDKITILILYARLCDHRKVLANFHRLGGSVFDTERATYASAHLADFLYPHPQILKNTHT